VLSSKQAAGAPAAAKKSARDGMAMKRLPFFLLLLAMGAPLTASGAVRSAESYGRVVIANFSPQAKMANVVFDHWQHRAQFTCRVCHVDIGFAMAKEETRMTAADNERGDFCGTCHNGKLLVAGAPLFKACSLTPTAADLERCIRCHFAGPAGQKKSDFDKFAEKMPRTTSGNGIDWEKAELSGLITPKDNVPGVATIKKPLPAPKDFSLDAKTTWMGNILFSHQKHAVWNGCEMCHPEIFTVSRGATKYNMLQISGGAYCGACHLSVAFPLHDCARCHLDPVQ
jgi:c(7)-type cytochrome triheme protein